MYQAESFIAPAENVPDDVYWKALADDERLRLEDLKASKACRDRVLQLRQEYLDRLYGIIGKQNLQAYHKDQEIRIERMQEARRQCPPTYDGDVQLEDIRRKIREKSDAFFVQSGVDLSKVVSLQKEYQEKILNAFYDTIRAGEETSGKAPEKNRTYTPPYDGGLWGYSWEKTDVRRVATPLFGHWLNSATGEVGNWTYTLVNDSGEDDESHILYRTAVRQWHRMGRSGQLAVRVRLENVNDPYYGMIVNELGRSSVIVIQDVRVYARTVSPSPIVGRATYHAGGGPRIDTNRRTHYWERSWAEEGDVNLRIREVFEADSWLLVEVGIENLNYFWANDVSVASHQTARYIIREIGLSTHS